MISYAPDGQRLETVLLDAMVINTRFPVNFSRLEGACTMADYQFSTIWRVEASVQEVWDVFPIRTGGLNGGEVWNASLR